MYFPIPILQHPRTAFLVLGGDYLVQSNCGNDASLYVLFCSVQYFTTSHMLYRAHLHGMNGSYGMGMANGN